MFLTNQASQRSRTFRFPPRWPRASSRGGFRLPSVSGQADSFYDSQWEDHWWLSQETWASGGTWQNATYDDYNYRYRWTKTWQGQGDGAVSSSASNHVTGLENGSESGWWTHTVPEGSGSGSSSSTSWGSPWDHSYDTTVSYPGFWEARYYGRDYGGGGVEDCARSAGPGIIGPLWAPTPSLQESRPEAEP